MMEIDVMTDAEVLNELAQLKQGFTDAEAQLLDRRLRQRAYFTGWVGDPAKQSPRGVLYEARQIHDFT